MRVLVGARVFGEAEGIRVRYGLVLGDAAFEELWVKMDKGAKGRVSFAEFVVRLSLRPPLFTAFCPTPLNPQPFHGVFPKPSPYEYPDGQAPCRKVASRPGADAARARTNTRGTHGLVATRSG